MSPAGGSSGGTSRGVLKGDILVNRPEQTNSEYEPSLSYQFLLKGKNTILLVLLFKSGHIGQIIS